jgi:hypothetical protein
MKIVKIVSLILGILFMLLSGLSFIVSLLLPAMTDNRVSFEESMLGLIPSVIIFFLAFVLTIISAILVVKGRKAVTQ